MTWKMSPSSLTYEILYNLLRLTISHEHNPWICFVLTTLMDSRDVRLDQIRLHLRLYHHQHIGLDH